MSGPLDLITSSQKQTLPPLRVHHFLLWTAAMSALMTLSQDAFQAEFPVAFHIDAFCRAMTSAIATSTVGLLFYWRRFGHRVFNNIGQILLGAIALHFLIGTLHVLINHYLSEWLTDSWTSYLTAAISLIEYLIYVIAFLAGWRWVADTRAWKSFCIAAGTGNTIYLLWACVVWYTTGGLGLGGWVFSLVVILGLGLPLLWLGLCVWATVDDRRQCLSRHWTHWCGVILWGAEIATQLIWTAYAYAMN